MSRKNTIYDPNVMPLQAANIDLFTYNKKHKYLITEMSTLEMYVNTMQQIYKDACDVGFAIYSPKTGRTEIFYKAETERIGGEITSWIFMPLRKEVGCKVVVLND